MGMEFWWTMRQELGVTTILFVVLFAGMFVRISNARLLAFVQLLLLLLLVLPWIGELPHGTLFGPMFITSGLASVQKWILVLAVYLVSILFSDWLREFKHLPEFFVLLLSALLGMHVFISANHLLTFWLGLELATIPLAAMVNLEVNKRSSSEAAMKLILSSGLASGIMLFGISLLYGATGTLQFAELSGLLQANDGIVLLGFVMLFAALAFKLSVVPFHFWTADVYQGASMPVAAVLSVVSKAAAAFVLLVLVQRVFAALDVAATWMIALLAVVTMTMGNLFALRQTVVKRFLAFSSIAQVGFILVAVIGAQPQGQVAVVYFLAVYLFANLMAFSIAQIVERSTSGTLLLEHFKGLYHRSPGLAWMMALALFSLAGIPPTAGFFGKLFLLQAAVGREMYWLVGIAGLNMILSLFYYLRVVRYMFMEKPLEETILPVAWSRSTWLGLMICSLGIVLAGVWSWGYDYILNLL